MTHRIIPIRASSFGNFFDCGYRFEWEQIMKKTRPSSLRAHLGTSIHAGTAAFDQAALEGQPITPTEAAAVTMDTFLSPKGEVDLRDDKLTIKEAEAIGLTLTARYCTQIAPSLQFESVEMPLEPWNIDCGDGLIIQLTGTMDRARVLQNEHTVRIADIKTGGRLISDGIVSVKGRAPQLGTYELLYQQTTGRETSGSQIIALQTTKRAEVGVSRVFDAKAMMVGDDEREGLLQVAAKALKAGLFMPNPQSSLCSERYCARWGVCKYHE